MTLTRRKVLKGLLGGAAVTVGLPYFETFLGVHKTASAQNSIFPRRFGMFFWGNGMIPDFWVPQGEGTEWELSESLTPLAAFKDDISVISGLNVMVPNSIAHHSGAAGILTAAPLLQEGGRNTFQLPTIDQVIAEQIGNDTRFRSLEIAVDGGTNVSFTGPDSPAPAESSPFALFERLFGAGFRLPGEDGEVDPRLGLRRSVLDAVLDDARSLNGQLGTADRVRLEQHFEGIRALELRLARLEEDPPNFAACAVPGQPENEYPDIDGRPQLQAKSRAMCDIMALSLACDQTRVFSHAFTPWLTNSLFPDALDGHHKLTHEEPGAQPQVQAIVLQIMHEYAYLLETLKQIPEGDGTLLDNCAILALSEHSLGRTHSLEDMPIVIAGSAGGVLKQGIHHRSLGENATKLLLSLIRSMGINQADLGLEDAYASDGLGAIEV